MPHRIEKINKLIKQQLAEIITREINFKPGVFLTISKVDTARDLRYTRISVSIFPEKEDSYAMETLRKETYHLQGELNKKLSLKIMPKMEFLIDKTEFKADVVEKLLIDINKK
ncbi:MAG: ribosome-binding factor A [bacterium]|nr:ribosome-binding factor A [bacterium]